MSLTEIMQAASKLKPRQRASLRAYLFMLERINDPEWQAEMARRARRMKAGHAISSAEVTRRLATKRAKAG